MIEVWGECGSHRSERLTCQSALQQSTTQCLYLIVQIFMMDRCSDCTGDG